MRRETALVLCLLPVLAGALGLAFSGPGVDVSRPATLLAVALAGGGWVGALLLSRDARGGVALGLVVAAGAVCVRLPFLAVDPLLSDDAYRYAWEGELVRGGGDPYRDAPASDALAEMRARHAAAAADVNHPEVAAAYPPLAQAVHAGVVAAGGGLEHRARVAFLLRAFYAVCDLLVCVPLLALLRRRALSPARVVAWAWSPLAALEFAGGAHLDALALLCAVAALACLPPGVRAGTHRAVGAAVLLAAGTAVKLLPVALVPFALRRSRSRALAGLAFALGLAACAAPFVVLTGHLPRPGGLADYAFRWESFSLLYRRVEPVLARFLEPDESWSDPRRVGRALVLVGWLALGAYAWRRRLEPARAALWLFGGFLVLTPTLHPWYLTWIVPFLALRPVPAWCFLCAAAPLLYWPVEGWRTEGVWTEPAWLFPALALPFWALLALGARRRATGGEA